MESAGSGGLSPADTGMGEGAYRIWQGGGVMLESGYIKFGAVKDEQENLDHAVQDVLNIESTNGVEPVSNNDVPGAQKSRELLFENNSKVSIYRIYAGDGVIV